MWQMEQWVSRNVCICTKEIATLDGAIIHFIRRNNLVILFFTYTKYHGGRHCKGAATIECAVSSTVCQCAHA